MVVISLVFTKFQSNFAWKTIGKHSLQPVVLCLQTTLSIGCKKTVATASSPGPDFPYRLLRLQPRAEEFPEAAKNVFVSFFELLCLGIL